MTCLVHMSVYKFLPSKILINENIPLPEYHPAMACSTSRLYVIIHINGSHSVDACYEVYNLHAAIFAHWNSVLIFFLSD